MSLDYSKLRDESLLYMICRRHEAALGELYTIRWSIAARRWVRCLLHWFRKRRLDGLN